MKKILPLFCAAVLLVMLALPSSASSVRLVDNADLLSEQEEASLLAKLDEKSNALDFDIVIVTVTSTGYSTAEQFADDYYDYNDYRDDGVLLLIDMGDRAWHITTSGYGIEALTDYGLEHIEDNIIGYMSSGSWYNAFSVFTNECAELVESAKNGEIYDAPTYDPYDPYNPYDPYDPYNPYEPYDEDTSFPVVRNLIISVIIGFIASLITVSVMKASLKSVSSQQSASEYAVRETFDIRKQTDTFLYRNVNRVARPKETTSYSSGPSSHGSSIHTSSSGHSHGGRGGHF